MPLLKLSALVGFSVRGAERQRPKKGVWCCVSLYNSDLGRHVWCIWKRRHLARTSICASRDAYILYECAMGKIRTSLTKIIETPIILTHIEDGEYLPIDAKTPRLSIIP